MFNEIRECEVCGEIKPVQVCSSSLGGISFAYCKDCLEADIEPWSMLVAHMSGCDLTYETVNDGYVQLIDRCLAFHHKTLDQLKSDIDESDRQFYLAMEEEDRKEGN